MALLEAMSCGRPVVGSRVGGIQSLVTDGEDGLLAPPGNPGALAEAVLRILLDPALAARLSTNARRRACDFDWNENASRTLELFRQLLESNGSEQIAASSSVVSR